MPGKSEFDDTWIPGQELWEYLDNDYEGFGTSSLEDVKAGGDCANTTPNAIQQMPVEGSVVGGQCYPENTHYPLNSGNNQHRNSAGEARNEVGGNGANTTPNAIQQVPGSVVGSSLSYENIHYLLQNGRDDLFTMPRVTDQLPTKILEDPPGGDTAVSLSQPMAPQPQIVVRVVRRIRPKIHEEEPSHVPMEAMNVGPQQAPLMIHPQQQQQVGLPVSNSQPPNTYQTVLFTPLQQSTPIAIAPQQQPHPTPVSQKGGGVVDVPALTDMEGDYGFSVCIEEKERTTKSPMWLMSKITKKLYTNINKAVPFEIRLKKKAPANFRIRAVVVFSSAQFLRTNVTRCPNHASSADVTNHDFPYPTHVLRADHPSADYEESHNGRLSVIVPLDILQDGSDYTPILLRFMCLGSCVGGINRRPIAIILTLENNLGHLYGRNVIDVRVCACPTRDIRTDEQTLMNKGVKRRGSSIQDKTQVIRKKPKNVTHTGTVVEPKTEPPEDEDKVYCIQVRGLALFNLLSDMKESYLKNHPEYAAKYPDDCIRFQNEDDSEDELKGNTLQRIGVGDSETVNWDSGGDSPQRIMFNESHLDTLNETKNNSPLSKLTPNISISPTPAKLRLWHEDTDNEVIGFTRGESLEYPSINKSQSSDLIPNSKSNSNSLNTESITANSSVVPGQFIKNIKHIPVMQVNSYKPGGSALKTKSVPVLKCTYRNQYGDERSNRNSEKKNARGNIQYSSLDSTEISYGHSTGEEYLSPGSPEMLAANVLVEGFKAKMITKQ